MIPRAGFGCWLTALLSGRPGSGLRGYPPVRDRLNTGSHASPSLFTDRQGPQARWRRTGPVSLQISSLTDWPVPTDGCFPRLICTALTRWPVALRVTCRNTAISSSLVSLSAALKSAASHSCIRWWTPRVSALPFFVSSGSTIRRSSQGYRRVIRPNLTGLFTVRLIRDTLTGNTWLSWVVVHFSRPGGAGAARAPRATGRGTI